MDLPVWGVVSRTYHVRLKASLTSSHVPIVLHEQRMSGIGSYELE